MCIRDRLSIRRVEVSFSWIGISWVLLDEVDELGVGLDVGLLLLRGRRIGI